MTPPAVNLIINLTHLQTKLEMRLSGPLSIHGISFTEYLVLKELNQAREKKLRRVDLAQRIGLTASGVTRLLNPMQKIGLVCKEEAARDARVSLVALTSTGERIFMEADTSVAQTAESFIGQLSDDDRSKLLELISSLL